MENESVQEQAIHGAKQKHAEGASSKRKLDESEEAPARLKAEESEEALAMLRADESEEALARLKADESEENLWSAVIAFQHHPFCTVSGLPFTYTLKVGKRGSYTNELLIDRRENSKTLSRSSVMLAFRAAQEKQGQVIARPKELGDIRGISYIYPMLWRFGLIKVPEKTAQKMV